MGNRATISREQILERAYGLASERGLAHLGIREVARACGVSVGSVYNYFPSKAELVADVVGAFWEQALSAQDLHAHVGDGFVDFCRRLDGALREAGGRFHDGWAAQLGALDARSLAVAHEREDACFAHIERGLREVLERDATVDQDLLVGPLAPERLCRAVWRGILGSYRDGTDDARTLLALVGVALGGGDGAAAGMAPGSENVADMGTVPDGGDASDAGAAPGNGSEEANA